MNIITETLDPVIIPPRYLHYRLSKSLSVLNAQLLVSPLQHVHTCIHPTQHHTSHTYILARLHHVTATTPDNFYLTTPMHAANLSKL